MLLWQEYKAVHPDGYQYSQFCNLYRQWAGRIDPVMRQEHRPGERLYVDWAGMTVPIVALFSGNPLQASICDCSNCGSPSVMS
jgi:transposase